jgi:peptide/nickel transport system substrate-binding protein
VSEAQQGASGNGIADERVTRRGVLRGGLVGTGLVILGAGAPTAQSAIRKRGATRTVNIVRASDLTTLDIRKAGSAVDLAIIRNIADPLIRATHSSESDLGPWLATSWKAVSPTHWRFKLRKGVTFTDGTPFNAETVKWTIDNLANEKTNVNAIVMHAVKGAKVVDAYTVDVITRYPSGAVPGQLQTVANMLDPTWEKSKKRSPDKLVGTGAGVLDHWSKGQEIVLKANPNYWKGKLSYDRAVIRPVTDAQTRANTAAAGQADIITNILPQDVPRLSSVTGMHIERKISTRVAQIRIQDNVAPFDNKLVRQALNYAVDVPSIVTNVFKGFGKPLNAQAIGSFANGWQKDIKPYPHDPAKAKSLLTQAGFPSGFSTKIGTPQGKDTGDYEFVQALAGQLKEVGINAEVVLHEIGEWASMYSGLQPADPLFYYSSGNFIPTVENSLVDYLTPASFQVHDANLKKIFDKLVRAVDAKKRAALNREAQVFLADYCPAIFGYQLEGAFAVSDRIAWTPRSYIDWIYMDEIKWKG